MAQFDLYRNGDPDSSKTYPYFVDVQSGLMDDLNTRVVIPLTPLRLLGAHGMERLCPSLTSRAKPTRS